MLFGRQFIISMIKFSIDISDDKLEITEELMALVATIRSKFVIMDIGNTGKNSCVISFILYPIYLTKKSYQFCRFTPILIQKNEWIGPVLRPFAVRCEKV